jgi:hypothetical protein
MLRRFCFFGLAWRTLSVDSKPRKQMLLAKSKLQQSVVREEFFVQEMAKASKELLCKFSMLLPTAFFLSIEH